MATDYLQTLVNSVASRIGRAPSAPNPSNFGDNVLGWRALQGARSQYASAQAQYSENLNQALARTQTKPISGAAPNRSNYVSVGDPNRAIKGSSTQLFFNQDAWARDQAAYMRQNPQYAGWSDSDIANYLTQGANLDDQGLAGLEFWTGQNIAWRQAQEQAKKDRDRMLAELEDYRSSWSEENMQAVLRQEEAAANAEINQILAQVQQEAASYGRSTSAYVTGNLRARLVAERSDRIALRRYELERERDAQTQYYLSALDNVFSNTQINLTDPAVAAQIMGQVGVAQAK